MQASASSPQRRRACLCSTPPTEVLESRLLLTLTAYPAESSAPLLNPGKGWVVYQSFANASPSVWAKASVGYTRFAWRDVETADGTYNWSLIDDQLNDCISRGKKFAFGVMPAYVNSSTFWVSMPDWLISAGAQYYNASLAPACKVPVWTDSVFISKMGQFVTALKDRYNGNPNIAYIDARTFGNWGEWHLYYFGGTDPGDAVKRQYLDQWSGFDKTQVIVPISDSTGMYPGGHGYYARDTYGFGYREDSSEQAARYSTCGPGLNVAPAVAEWSTSYAALKPSWTDAMISGGINGSMYTYMNLGQWNGTDADSFLADHGSLVDQYQNTMGYWFKLTQVDFPDDLGNGSAGSISFKVRNDGVAPIYVNWSNTAAPVTYVRLALLDSNNNVLATTGALSGINPFNWKPGQTITNTAGFSFPTTANAAHLAIGVFSSVSLSNPDIQFAVTGGLANGWYPLVIPSQPTDIALAPASIAENEPVGSAVGRFSTVDPGVGDTFTYTLVAGAGGSDNSSFTINGDQLLTAAVFNYAVQNSYSIRVRTTDSGGLSFEKVFVISITPDQTIPTASLVSAPNLSWRNLGDSFAEVIVRFHDVNLDPASINGDELAVTGPGGPLVVTLVGTTVVDAQTVDATYHLVPSDGSWTAADDGMYTMTVPAGRFADTAGNHNVLTALGTFTSAVSMANAQTLIVNGTLGADAISVTIQGLYYQVVLNGEETWYPGNQVSGINVRGFAGNDTITVGPGIMGVTIDGGLGDDSITGGDGADSIRGDDGNDTILGGAGNDTIMGNTGDDCLVGAGGADCLQGGLGADTLDGGMGNDTLLGGDGRDTILGGDGDDWIEGRGKQDTIYAGAGNDTVYGGAGSDMIYGEDGDDWVDVGVSAVFHDTVDGGAGSDLIRCDSDDVLTGCEGVWPV